MNDFKFYLLLLLLYSSYCFYSRLYQSSSSMFIYFHFHIYIYINIYKPQKLFCIQPDTSQIYLYIHYNRLWKQDIPHLFCFFLFFVKPLENQCFCFNRSLDFFFFLFCIVIPKKGIYYEHTSTSFLIDCANKHDHTRQFLSVTFFFGPGSALKRDTSCKTKVCSCLAQDVIASCIAWCLFLSVAFFSFVCVCVCMQYGNECQKDFTVCTQSASCYLIQMSGGVSKQHTDW